MNWDNLSLVILAAFGCLTLLLTQVSEVLAKLPQIIRAWRRVRNELRNGAPDAMPALRTCDEQSAVDRDSGVRDADTASGEG
ncbi:hypothetical protein [Streptomyces sp. PTY087I2]|uniref:hypothetical protein n=1 Tax=Streptomyces sp. PTY087I2 TaxID=1819298 RepID=UPI00080BB7C2|nr:hypothetical protein [Streptomyces sp. PTY087I2]OCC07659.1 hypothetical protein A3Q37_06548 [Streptomyces sp. PTY087I2]